MGNRRWRIKSWVGAGVVCFRVAAGVVNDATVREEDAGSGI